mmetsp:Transcript_17640/g.38156  ORF Transcript_17640/g.38156 Transcript_17640/m.38156 type:complete len:86 (-) Transcript_17640:470-727(-)
MHVLDEDFEVNGRGVRVGEASVFTHDGNDGDCEVIASVKREWTKGRGVAPQWRGVGDNTMASVLIEKERLSFLASVHAIDNANLF